METKKRKVNLIKALKELKIHDNRSNKIEEHINEFIERVCDNFKVLSDLNFLVLTVLKEQKGVIKSDGFYEEEYPLIVKFVQDKIKEDENYGNETIKKLQKVEDFFEEFDV